MRRTICACVFGVMTTAPVSAGEFEGLLEEVWVNGQTVEDVGWIKTSSPITALACASTGWFILDLTKPSMKTALSFALAAQMAGQTVMIRGTGLCFATFEYVQLIAVK